MIINATNIGKQLNGLGVYSLQLSKYFLSINLDSKIYINANAKIHFTKEEQKRLTILPSKISPDYGFKGHIYRLWEAQKFKDDTLFNTSQIELAFFNKNQIVTVHDIIPLLFPEYHRKQYHFFKYLLPIVLKKIKSIITVSYHTKKLLISYYGIDANKIEVIHNGVVIPKAIKSKKEDYILFVGRPSYAKNVVRMIEAYCLAKNKYRIKEKLYIVGFNQGDMRLKECQDIKFFGYVDNMTLENLYRKAKLLFFPTLYEGFGYPVLEAMKFGTPVLTSDVSSLPEIGEDAVLYSNPIDINELSRNLQKILQSSDMQNEFIERGFNQVKKFSIDKSMSKYREFLF